MGADAKDLVVKLQNDINVFLYHALPLCVILTDEKLYSWYYEHYMQLFSISYTTQEGKQCFELDFLEREDAYKDILQEIPLDYNIMSQEKNIISFITNAVEAEYYVVARVDDYYMPWSPSHNKHHIIHEHLIYGLDNVARRFSIIGFDRNWTFKLMTVKYDCFVRAYQKGMEFIGQATRFHRDDGFPQAGIPALHQGIVKLMKIKAFNGDYPFDVDRFLQELYGYIFSLADSAKNYFANSWISHMVSWQLHDTPAQFNYQGISGQLRFGFDIYDEFERYLNNLLMGDAIADYRPVHCLFEHKKALQIRIAYVSSLLPASQKLIDILEAYNAIVDTFQLVRLKFLKYTKSNDNATINQIREIVHAAKKDELILLVDLYKQVQLLLQQNATWYKGASV